MFKRWIIHSGKAVKHINKGDVVIHSMHLCPNFCFFSPPVNRTVSRDIYLLKIASGSGEKVLDCVGVVLTSYGVAVVAFFLFANDSQLYRTGLVCSYMMLHTVHLTVCGDLEEN